MSAPTSLGRGLHARTRLTLWYMALLVSTFVTVGAFADLLVERMLHANADELLRSKSAAIVSEVEMAKGRLSFSPDAPGGRTKAGAPRLVVGLDLVRIWDRDRRSVYRQEDLDEIPDLDPSAMDNILNDTPRFTTTRGAGGTPIRLYTEPIRDRERVIGAIQIGRSQADVESLLAQLRVAGGVILMVALLLGWLGGRFLAGRALAPIDRITRAAEQIGARDLSLRLLGPPVDDELGRLSRAFNGMIGRLEEAFHRQQRFTADASHELRTPLATIRSEVEVALSSPRDSEQDTHVYTSVCEEIDRLAALVESLLVVARADSGEPLAFALVDLEEVMFDVAARCAVRAQGQGIRLALDPEDVGPVSGEPMLLGQLVTNLVDNALRHTPPGGVVRLSLGHQREHVWLAVADSGEGIPAHHLPHIFDRFYRVDSARRRDTGGVGLGLAICEWIARAHGGRIEVRSEVGASTAFTVWLPTSDRGLTGTAAQSGQPPAQTGPLDDGQMTGLTRVSA